MKTALHLRLPCLALGILALATVSSQAATLLFTDTFNRSNTTSPNGGLGTNYTLPGAGDLYINSQKATQGVATEDLAIYNGFTLSQTLAESATFAATSTGSWLGDVFNYVDANDYYQVRVKVNGSSSTWQFLQIVGGSLGLVTSGTITASLTTATPYILTVDSTATPGTYSFTFTDSTGTTTYASSSSLTDSTLALGGEAGIDINGAVGTYASSYSLSTTAVPEPIQGALLFMAALACSLPGLRRTRPSRS